MNFEPLKNFLDCCLPSLSIPGSDTVIYKDGVEVFRYQSGYDSITHKAPVRRDALYNMYSVSKVTTCVAAVQLIEKGEISVDDPVYAYFPEYKTLSVRKKHADGTEYIEDSKKPMLIKHLLTMTSGLNYNLTSASINSVKERTDGKSPTLDIVRALAGEPLDFEPGTDYKYGLSLDVIGGLVELVSGMKFSEYLEQNIFNPLGMKNTSFGFTEQKLARIATQYSYDAERKCAVEIPKNENPYVFGTEYESGGAGLISCVDDQILLAEALTHMGIGNNGNRILSSYGVNLMRTNQLDEKCMASFNFQIGHTKGYGYGFGVRVNVDPYRNGNLAPVGEFGWDGAKLSYFSSHPEMRVSVFQAQHMGGLHHTVIPRLRNIICACLDY